MTLRLSKTLDILYHILDTIYNKKPRPTWLDGVPRLCGAGVVLRSKAIIP